MNVVKYLVFLSLFLNFSTGWAKTANPVVIIKTSLGEITAELNQEKAPESVKNFLSYVQKKHYDGTIFHRVISGFMIQGGGFDKEMNQKPTQAPIKNEAGNGLKNERYTLAMARTNVVDSASAQFFINTADNAFLNHASESEDRFGYAVFGKVLTGQKTVDQIEKVSTHDFQGNQNVPEKPVLILSIKLKK